MTSPHASDRPAAAGVFVVRDPEVCAALETMLAPHRTDHSPTPGDDGADLMARALAYVGAHMTISAGKDATIEELLDAVYATARDVGREQAAAEHRKSAEQDQDRLHETQSDLAATEQDLDATRQQLQDALAKITELEARPSGRRPTVSALRLQDQKAFAALADRMDREALSQTKTVAAALRVAAQGVRDEIAIIYGGAKRKAS